MTAQPYPLDPVVASLREALRGAQSRRRRRSTLLCALLAAFAITGVALGATYGGWWNEPVFRPVATNLTLPAINGRDIITGRAVSTRSLVGSPSFIVIWQSYCPPCNPVLSTVEDFARTNPTVHLLGLDVDDLTGPSRRTLRMLHITFPSTVAASDLLNRYGVSGYPTILAFNRDGLLVGSAAGPLSLQDLDNELRHLRAG